MLVSAKNQYNSRNLKHLYSCYLEFLKSRFVNNKRVAPCIAKVAVIFNNWIEEFLIKELKTGQIDIMDNASFYKSKKIRELIEQADCKLIFLPPYSPELNKIEKF